jgi:hypothetical protein
MSKRLNQENEEEILRRNRILYLQVGLYNKDMMKGLTRQKFSSRPCPLVRLRFQFSIRRRIRDSEEREEAERAVQGLIKEGFNQMLLMSSTSYKIHISVGRLTSETKEKLKTGYIQRLFMVVLVYLRMLRCT